ncbi:MAG: hypothetical protein NZ523_13615 [Elioraea sp.]|nr:hypothetical protein [Elioraea sp.]
MSEQRAAGRARAASEAHRRAAGREERRRAKSKTFRALTLIAGRASGWKTAKTTGLWKARLERWERPLPRQGQVRV